MNGSIPTEVESVKAVITTHAPEREQKRNAERNIRNRSMGSSHILIASAATALRHLHGMSSPTEASSGL
jgi:hypothetical protein